MSLTAFAKFLRGIKAGRAHALHELTKPTAETIVANESEAAHQGVKPAKCSIPETSGMPEEHEAHSR